MPGNLFDAGWSTFQETDRRKEKADRSGRSQADLDSTLALLAAVKTMDFLDLPRTNVHAFTLPGFGTTRRTRTNATKLCKALGVSFDRGKYPPHLHFPA